MGHIGVADFEVGKSIQSAYCNGDTGRLAVDLKDAKGNIILIFQVRFEEKAVVLNSYINGAYGREERPIGYNFEPLKKTTVEFAAKDERIQILVDGGIFYNYTHRLPISSLAKVIFWSSGSDPPGTLLYLGVKFSEAHTQQPPMKQCIKIS